MSILEVLALTLVALVIGSISHPKIRSHLLLAASIIVVYWLQSRTTTIYNVTFWLPTFTIVFAAFPWALTSPSETRTLKKNWHGFLTAIIMIFAINLTRYFGETNLLFPNIAIPRPIIVFSVLAAISLALVISLRISALKQAALPILLLITLLIFIIIKTPLLNNYVYAAVSEYTGSPPRSNGFFVWLGFSYFGFRIIHTIRDRQNGVLPPVTFNEYMNYAIFFPSFAAGPIDRVERFSMDLNKIKPRANLDWSDAGGRLVVGLFKKFVIADALAAFALNSDTAAHISSSGWYWTLLYAYAFQIYFDFSGYTDIAIGLSKLMGINLPENFNSPYLKSNITLFWNSWHMTLTQWFRSYFFNPLQRGLRSSPVQIPSWILILILQVSTMVLIGLWHGVALNFMVWGLWHGAGLFIHNRWKEYTGPRFSTWAINPFRKNILSICGIFLTFHYVALGWLFFALPANQIPTALKMLFGFNS